MPVPAGMFGNVEQLGATLPGPGYKNWQALLMETALTAVPLSVILGTASAAQNVGALGVGGYTTPAGLSSAPVTGALINSASSFAQALVGGDWTAYRVYVAGPLLGAAITVGCACRGPRRRPDLPRGGLRRAHAGTSGGECNARPGD
ncbi:MAG: aquaporin [Solirubrobacteraceae bacterium]